MGIDDIADRLTGGLEPGEAFEQQFLSKRPKSQWPSYIDETAVDVSVGIGIGDTDLDRVGFGREVGPYYAQGLRKVTGDRSDVTAILGEVVSDDELGEIAYRLNELAYELERSDTGLRDVRHAVEVLIRKITASQTSETIDNFGEDGTAAISDVVVEMLSDEVVARHADTIVDEFENAMGGGLLARLDEPRMTTQLWAHQAEALDAWAESGYRGYADMATATGKTVLGLAAIALRYGSLHAADQAIDRGDPEPGAGQTVKDCVLIVAHNELILEQWRREFDAHLNVPKERTSGGTEVELTWGTIEFRTAQSLLNEERNDYELVLLDEAHHYVTGGRWGELLDEFDGEILALSGSVDDAGVDSEDLQTRLRNQVGPEVIRYSITDAQRDGVIPAFDWEVRYAPYASDEEFGEVTKALETTFDEFRSRLERGAVDIEPGVRLRTYEDVRRYSHTTEGRELKQIDETFRELSTGAFSRRTRRWNMSPSLESVVEIAVDHPTDHVVVLADSNAQVEQLVERLQDRGVHDEVVTATTRLDRSALRDRLDEFDAAEGGGVLVGTGDLIGEGVDVPNARVGINMATGGVNTELVQRIGRVLRNPTGNKHARFYNVVGVPGAEEMIPREDGLRLLKDAAAFCGLGDRFQNLPGFATASGTDDEALATQLGAGSRIIRELVEEGTYEYPTDEIAARHLRELLSTVESTVDDGVDAVLAEWSQYAWTDDTTPDPYEVVVTDETGEPVTDVQVTFQTGDRSERVATTSDGRSSFDIDRRHEGASLTVAAEDGRYEATEQTVDLTPGETHEVEVTTVETDGSNDGGDDESTSDGPEPEGPGDVPLPRGEDEEIVRAIREVAWEVDGAPRTIQFQQMGSIPLDRVLGAYDRWHDALVAAGVADGVPPTDPESPVSREEDDGQPEETAEDETDQTDARPGANALAEWYESVSELAELVGAVVDIDGFGTAAQRSVLEQWAEDIRSRAFGGEDSLGGRQKEENDVTMPEYRDAYGDGDRVTDYQIVETRDVSEMVRAILAITGKFDEDREFHLPVPPGADEPLPVVVTTTEEIESARDRLGDVMAATYDEGDEDVRSTDSETTSEGLLKAIRRIANDLDRPIKTTDLREQSEFSHVAYRSEYDSWDDAVEAAGVDRRESFLRELHRVAEIVGRVPKQVDMNDHGRISAGPFGRYFGSWRAAVEAYRAEYGPEESS